MKIRGPDIWTQTHQSPHLLSLELEPATGVKPTTNGYKSVGPTITSLKRGPGAAGRWKAADTSSPTEQPKLPKKISGGLRCTQSAPKRDSSGVRGPSPGPTQMTVSIEFSGGAQTRI